MNELIAISEPIRSSWSVWIISVILFWIVVSFFQNFFFSARRLRKELSASIAALIRIKAESKGPVTDLDGIAKNAMNFESVAHQWTEYSKTLHPQKEMDEQGQMRVRRWRATTLAESFFTDQALVDTRLKVDCKRSTNPASCSSRAIVMDAMVARPLFHAAGSTMRQGSSAS